MARRQPDRPSPRPHPPTDRPLKVYALASEQHFVDHLAPIWKALPAEVRGVFYTGGGPGNPRLSHHQAIAVHGIEEACTGLPRRKTYGLALTAASGDLNRTVRSAPFMRAVFFEHGCGLAYNRWQNSYAGAHHRPNVDLFIFPNELSAVRQRSVHTERRVEVIGSSPRLDPWASGGKLHKTLERRQRRSAQPTVCLSFHWDCPVVSETRTALYWYRKHFGELLGRGYEVVGHAHPRIIDQAALAYKQFGIETIRDFDEVLARADLYAVDNSSTLYEFAATGRPVVVLNCPRYRKTVSHGLRFWSHIPGVQVEGPGELPAAIERALLDPPDLRELRQRAVNAVFPRLDGKATERAVALVLEQLAVTAAEYPEPDMVVSESSAPVWVVKGPQGSVHEFLVQGEANRLFKKRGGTEKGWTIEKIEDPSETRGPVTSSTAGRTTAHVDPAFERKVAPKGGGRYASRAAALRRR